MTASSDYFLECYIFYCFDFMNEWIKEAKKIRWCKQFQGIITEYLKNNLLLFSHPTWRIVNDSLSHSHTVYSTARKLLESFRSCRKYSTGTVSSYDAKRACWVLNTSFRDNHHSPLLLCFSLCFTQKNIWSKNMSLDLSVSGTFDPKTK